MILFYQLFIALLFLALTFMTCKSFEAKKEIMLAEFPEIPQACFYVAVFVIFGCVYLVIGAASAAVCLLVSCLA